MKIINNENKSIKYSFIKYYCIFYFNNFMPIIMLNSYFYFILLYRNNIICPRTHNK